MICAQMNRRCSPCQSFCQSETKKTIGVFCRADFLELSRNVTFNLCSLSKPASTHANLLQTLAADSAAFGEQVLKVGSDGVSGGDQGGFDVGIPGILG